MKITTSIDISAPVDKVFQVFTNLEEISNHVDGIKNIEVLEKSSKMELGTKWRETRVIFGKEASEVMWVTEINPSKNYVVEAESHGTKYHSEYIFERVNNNTRVTVSFSGKPISISAKLMSFMGFLFSGSMKKMLLQDMKDLKSVCEK